MKSTVTIGGRLFAAVLALISINSRTPASVSQPEPAAKAVPLQRKHGPIRIHQRYKDQQYDSYNWSGYAVTGSSGTVTDVKGSWTVPSVNCDTTPTGYSAFWVGLGGFSSGSVEQTGTDSDCVSANSKTVTPTYYAWFEFYPNPGYEIQFPHGVQANDLMSAEVTYAGQVSGGGHRGSGAQFMISITDVTKNETYKFTSTAPQANESSAEWIAEAPCCGRGDTALPLANFSSVQFSAGAATVQGNIGSIGSFGSDIQSITMVGRAAPHTLEAQPSSVLGGAFSVGWFTP